MTHDDTTPPLPSDPISPSDPRLTAYSFGELEGEDLALIEAALVNDETLRAVVDELRAFGGNLTNSLAAEIQNESAVSEALAGATAPAHEAAHTRRSAAPKRRGVLLHFPLALSYLTPALAACLAVVFWIRHDSEIQREQALIAPVALSLQVTDAPEASGAAVMANIASVTSAAEAKIEAAPAALLAPSVPPVALASAPAPAHVSTGKDADTRVINYADFVARKSARDAAPVRELAPVAEARDAFARSDSADRESEAPAPPAARSIAKSAEPKSVTSAKLASKEFGRVGNISGGTLLAASDRRFDGTSHLWDGDDWRLGPSSPRTGSTVVIKFSEFRSSVFIDPELALRAIQTRGSSKDLIEVDLVISPASTGYDWARQRQFAGLPITKEQLLLKDHRFVPGMPFFETDSMGKSLGPLLILKPLILPLAQRLDDGSVTLPLMRNSPESM